MKKFLIALFCAGTLNACYSNSIADIPINADSFGEFRNAINVVCTKVDKSACEHLQNAINIQLPLNTLTDSIEYQEETEKIYRRLNNRTPREIVDIYKVMLLQNLKELNAKNIRLDKELQKLYTNYENTKHHASNITISEIGYDFTDLDNPLISFKITNDIEFPIDQLVAEAEFYSSSDIFLGRAKAFIQPLRVPIEPGGSFVVKKTLDSIPEEDLELIKVARNLKIKISIPSIQAIVDDKKSTEIFVLSLPYSYIKMQELLDENAQVYTETVEKINSIKIK